MRHPTVRFTIDSKKDLTTLCAFAADAKYDKGRSLRWGILRRHPYLRRLLQNPTHLPIAPIKKYIRGIYARNGAGFERDALQVQKMWRQKEQNFFQLTEELFGSLKWPHGKYVAYFTIWTMFPRFLEDKTFQIPFRHKKEGYINVIIAHEMLHFIFYRYFYRRYPEYKKPQYNYFAWNVSEIINVLIQNSSPWIKVFKRKTLPYPEHASAIHKLRTQFPSRRVPHIQMMTAAVLAEMKKRDSMGPYSRPQEKER